MADIKRAFVTLPSGQRQVHYRRAGDGPTVVLLHPSPGSSAGLVALIEALSERGRTVFAPDTPGFGESDPLPDDHPSAADFATTIREALTALGIQQFDLYGAHTGAKIALELAIAAPDLVASLVLDGLALYTPEEARRQLSAYTVSLAPEWDGSHVVRAWAYRRDMSLFWPWYDKTPANRRALDMPSAERLHAQVVDMLRGATTYQLGYAAAFSHPTREAVTRVAVPTRIIFRETDVLGEHVARFPPLPSNVAVETLGRVNELEQLVARLVSQTRAAPPGPQPPTRKSGGLTRDYLQTSHGQLHIRRGGPDTGIPLLMLHDVPGSSFSLLHLAEQLAAERPVLVPDLPGCGDSDAPEWPDPDLSLAPYADLLAEVFDGVDVYGIGTGAALALELASRHPARVGSLVLHDLPTYDAREQADLVANATPAIEPSWDGAHLLTAWNIARNRFLFRPWYRQSVATMLRRPFDTLDVHAAFMDILRAGRAWGCAARAAYRYPSAERLAACRVPWTRIDADAEPAAVREALITPARARTSA